MENNNTNSKNVYDKLLNAIQNKNFLSIVFVLIPVLIFLSYLVGNMFPQIAIKTRYGIFDILGTYIDLISCGATVILGAIALSQTNKLDRANKVLACKAFASDNYSKIIARNIKMNDYRQANIEEPLFYIDNYIGFGETHYAMIVGFDIIFDSSEYIKYIKLISLSINTGYVTTEDRKQGDFFFCDSFEDSEGYKRIYDFNPKEKTTCVSIKQDSSNNKVFHLFMAFENITSEEQITSSKLEKFKEQLIKSKKNQMCLSVEVVNSFDVITRGWFEFEFSIINERTHTINNMFITTGIDMDLTARTL
ncbi:MAG: hypothetical protein H6Q69_1555 [Firmicutes bacterium]|nr:hypothetical protein [Bacillota bacterium]